MKQSVLFTLLFATGISAVDLPEHVIYLHPKPGAVDISYRTGIICRVDPAFEGYTLNDFSVTVTGASSGPHTGRIVLSDNNVLFQPDDPYVPGESVSVTIVCERLGWTAPFAWEFSVNVLTDYGYLYKLADQADGPGPYLPCVATGEVTLINGVAVPSDFPAIKPEILTDGIAPGKIFITNWTGSHYLTIFENDGTPYFYKRLNQVSRDFKIQPSGDLSRCLNVAFAVMDSNCQDLRRVESDGGYLTDEHDFLLLPDGHYFLLAVGNRIMDMRSIITGGKADARVKDEHVQEFDEHGNLIFEWICFEYFKITDSEHIDLTNSKIDYLHMNSVDVDYDGNLIISSRHLSEVTKINRQTGDIIWRLGGKHNQFDFINDNDGISYQHDAKAVPGKPGHYTVFDNGNFHIPKFSRAVEFRLDTDAMTAERVWEYRLPSGDAYWMGNAQRLPNGNTLINWADQALPKATEVTPDGRVVYQADYISRSHAYRTFRYEWEHEVEVPYLIAENTPVSVNLIFNQFGDSTVREYQVFAGKRGQNAPQIAVTSNTWYQADLNNLENGEEYDFFVRAVHDNGAVSEKSNTETVRVNLIELGMNIIENGDFSRGYQYWLWSLSGSAEASRFIDDSHQLNIQITHGGSGLSDIQVRQEHIQLLNGLTYVLEFDAYADAPRPFEARLVNSRESLTDYSKAGLTALTTRNKHFRYEFFMENTTDTNARLQLNVGGYDVDVTIGGISVSVAGPSVNESTLENRLDRFQLYQNYPNPFNPSTSIKYAIAFQAHVRMELFNIRGEKILSLVDAHQSPGLYTVQWDGKNYLGKPVSNGLYLCSLRAGDYNRTIRIVLLK
jgi:hypothetical protein